MIRISRELSSDASQRSSTCHHPINANKMSTTTALKSHNTAQMVAPPTTVPLFNNNGCCGGFSKRAKTNTAAAAASVMTSLAADLCKVAKQAITSATTSTATMPTMPAMDAAVVVNSIIYSKPSFCSIVVDIGGKETTAPPPLANKTQIKEECVSAIKPLVNVQSNTPIPQANEGKSPLFAIPPHPDDAAHVYMMSTILNGSIHHHISEICDNLIAMGLFGMVENDNSEHDDESLIEFSYNDDDDDDEDDIEFLHSDEDVNRQKGYDAFDYDEDEDVDDEDEDSDCDSDEGGNDDYVNNNIEDYETDEDDACLYTCDGGQDVTDFCRAPLLVTKTPAHLLHSDKKKKVRFNTKPTVHVMRTWDYAYRAARKGEWEMYARDRERFKIRIQRTALTLNPILNREHRQKVYEQRFSELYTKGVEQEVEEIYVEKKNLPEDSSPEKLPPKIEEDKKNKNNQNQNKKKHRKKKKRKRRRPNF